MVMELAVQPKYVGLEFVRQYYTMLNRAPHMLHRFYANNSSFTHAGDNCSRETVIGQANIHKCIQDLNFKDCHAKIIFIDAQGTLNGGIMIQVAGELSNNGQPMRKFIQSFVLAPQSEKKYYVHNDIFRYYEDTYTEEEVAGEVLQDNGLVADQQPLQTEAMPSVVGAPLPEATVPGVQASGVPVAAPAQPVHAEYAAAPSHPPAATPVQGVVQAPQPPPIAQVVPQVMPPQQAIPQATQQMNGTADIAVNSVAAIPHIAPVMPSASVPKQPPPQTAPTVSSPPAAQQPAQHMNFEEEWSNSRSDSWSEEQTAESTTPVPSMPLHSPPAVTARAQQSECVHQVSSQPSQPASYASFLKGSSGSTAPVVQQVQPYLPRESGRSPTALPQTVQPPREPRESLPPRGERTDRYRGRGGYNRGMRGPTYSESSTSGERLNEQEGGNGMDGFMRRSTGPVTAPDSHQIFVGNLPKTINSEDLKKLFSRYGNVQDVRINAGKAKPINGKPSGQARDFGFIVFESEQAVQEVLKERSVLFGEHKINVEEKKPRKSEGGFGGPYGGRGAPIRNIIPQGGRGGFGRGDGGRGGLRGYSGGPPRR